MKLSPLLFSIMKEFKTCASWNICLLIGLHFSKWYVQCDDVPMCQATPQDSDQYQSYSINLDTSGRTQCGVLPRVLKVINRTQHHGECLQACARYPGCASYNFHYDTTQCDLFCYPAQLAPSTKCFHYVNDALAIHSYKIEVVTGSFNHSGTNSNVSLTLFSCVTSVGPFLLDGSGEDFEQGSTGTYYSNLTNVYPVNKIRLTSDYTGLDPNWFLDKVSVTDLKTGEVWTFNCACWFDEDTTLTRDLAIGEALHSFTVQVSSGNVTNVGSNANVTVYLYSTEAGDGPFRLGELDLSGPYTSAVYPITKIWVQHDSMGVNENWYLDEVVIQDSETGERWTFKCSCLLGPSTVLSKHIEPHGVVHSYRIEVTTGDVVGAGTDATIAFILFSRSDAEGPFFVDGSGNAFNRNTTGTYYKDSSVFPIEKIRVSHDNSGTGPDWFINTIVITDMTTGKEWSFFCSCWLGANTTLSTDLGNVTVCLPTWISLGGASCSGGQILSSITDLESCKTACLMDYSCSGVSWTSATRQCIAHSNANDFNTLTVPATMDLYVLNRCSPCTVCSPSWTILYETGSMYSAQQYGISDLPACLKACLVKPSCVGVDFTDICWHQTDYNVMTNNRFSASGSTQYVLNTRCSCNSDCTTSGTLTNDVSSYGAFRVDGINTVANCVSLCDATLDCVGLDFTCNYQCWFYSDVNIITSARHVEYGGKQYVVDRRCPYNKAFQPQWFSLYRYKSSGLANHMSGPSTLDQCATACLKNLNCVGYDWDLVQSYCYPHTNIDDFNSKDTPQNTDAANFVSVVLNLSPPCATCTPSWIELSWTASPDSTISYPVPDVDTCKNICVATPNCAAVGLTTANVCWIHVDYSLLTLNRVASPGDTQYVLVNRCPCYSAIHTYQIQIKTGNVNGAGTTSVVKLALFSPYSGEGPFQIGDPSTDFVQNTVGTWYRRTAVYPINEIRLSIGNDQWYLDLVIITNMFTAEQWTFNCSCWITDTTDLTVTSKL